MYLKQVLLEMLNESEVSSIRNNPSFAKWLRSSTGKKVSEYSDEEIKKQHTKFRKEEAEKTKKDYDDMPSKDDPRWKKDKE